MKRVLKWLLVIVFGLFLLAQLKRPARTNPVAEPSLALENQTQLDTRVASILDRSCADCHSNKTRWPWYSNVAPVSWFVIDHVDHGREHLNLSTWGNYEQRKKRDLLDGICELSREGEMPLSSYTPLHPGSKLTSDDVKAICDWTQAERDRTPPR